MTQTNPTKKERIATVNVQGKGLVDIYYIGGSAFELDFRNNPDDPVRATRAVIDKLIERGSIRITSPARYAEICALIDPVTGETKTHNADGTLKSMASQTLSMLADEDFLATGPDGQLHFNQNREQSKTPSSQIHVTSRRPETAPRDDLFPNQNNVDSAQAVPQRVKPQRPSQDTQPDDISAIPMDSPKTDDYDEYDGASPFSDMQNEPIQRNKTKNTEEDRQKKAEEKQAKREAFIEKLKGPDGRFCYPFIIMVAIAIILTIILFFVSHFISADIVNGVKKEKTETAPVEQVDGTEESKTYVREDFDPEDAVASYDIGSEYQESLATGFFSSLRQYIAAGNVDSVRSMVDLDAIATQMANAYANYASQKQNLDSAEKETLSQEYKTTFIQTETQHISEGDSNASIFGGRIREIRVKSGNESQIFVVMESIAGDHQRICYVMQKSDSGSWSISSVMDVSGYIEMICEGPYDGNYSYGVS